jgi:hypothetical protein
LGGELSLPHKPSIAVLPFSNMSGDPEQEYFAVVLQKTSLPPYPITDGFSSSREIRRSSIRGEPSM